MNFYQQDDNFKKEIKRIVFLTIGAAMIAFNINSFVSAGGLFPGGAAGISLLIQEIGTHFFSISIPYSVIYIPVNLIPIYIGFRYIGKKFTIYSFYVIATSSFFTDLMANITITYDVLLIAIFGGILNGLAISTCLYFGACAGGTDFISIFLSEKKGIDAWNYILMFNVCILVIAGLLFGFDRALYSIIFQFTTTQVISTLFKRYQKNTLWIVTAKPVQVYEKIREITNHGGTLMKGVGCYEGKEKDMIYSVVSSEEVNKVINEIQKIDSKAFINVMKTEQINGRFYKRPND